MAKKNEAAAVVTLADEPQIEETPKAAEPTLGQKLASETGSELVHEDDVSVTLRKGLSILAMNNAQGYESMLAVYRHNGF